MVVMAVVFAQLFVPKILSNWSWILKDFILQGYRNRLTVYIVLCV